MNIVDMIYQFAVIPVIAIEDANDSIGLANALKKGGLPIAEITFRTEAGEHAIKKISTECSDIIVGAGTILNVEQAKRAIDAGAKFIVSPGLDIETVRYCIANDILCIPGCATPTEMMMAYNAGAKYIKIFPAEDLGGLKYIKSCSSVFPVKFVPTGGINEANLESYISNEKIFACGGTWLAKKEMIANKEWVKIESLCKKACEIVQKCRKV